jgi:hypothetical protein
MSILFLYEEPFTIADNPSNRAKYLSETIRLTPEERADEIAVQKTILKFIIENQIGRVKDSELFHSDETDGGSWIWAINWFNFRSLVDNHRYVELINQLKANGQTGATAILNLHLRLGCMFDSVLLNTLCNRIMKSIQLISYEIPENHESISWEKIHQETPFIWLIILIQTVLKNDSKKAI